jgi:hypothetical protein
MAPTMCAGCAALCLGLAQAATDTLLELDFLPFVNPDMEIFYLSVSTFCPPCIRLAS